MNNLRRKPRGSDGPPMLGPTSRRLQDAFDTAQRFFWCNTDRGAEPGGNELEKRMQEREFAAAWVSFDYPDHMKRVRRGDLIRTYANGQGVIGIGRAKESRVEILGPDHPDRLREFEHGEHDEEWRIPVEWLAWDERASCQIQKPLRKSFLEIEGDSERLKKIRGHFLQGSDDGTS